jgi:hypothetical protein
MLALHVSNFFLIFVYLLMLYARSAFILSILSPLTPPYLKRISVFVCSYVRPLKGKNTNKEGTRKDKMTKRLIE